MALKRSTKLKHRLFAQYVVLGGLNATAAYGKAYNRDIKAKSTRNMASRLLADVGVQKHIETMRIRFLLDAEKAYNEQWKLAQDPSTPAYVKNDIYNEIQDRAGL